MKAIPVDNEVLANRLRKQTDEKCFPIARILWAVWFHP
jgi:hypothetical protein